MGRLFDMLMSQRLQEKSQQRLMEQRQALEQQQGQQEQQSLFASLMPAMQQIGTGDAGIIGPLMMNPATRGLGASMLQQALAARGGSPEAMPGKLGVPSFSDFTTESMADYQRTGDPRALRYRPDLLGQERADIARAREDRLRAMQGRPPVGVLEKMIDNESILAGMEATRQDMAPEYFGFVSDTLGDAVKEVRQRFGGEAEQPFVSFWNSMDLRQAEMRYKLFGATLTANELVAWNKIAIKPTDSFASAKAKLDAQERALQRGTRIQTEVLQRQGYDTRGPAQQQRPPLSSFGAP